MCAARLLAGWAQSDPIWSTASRLAALDPQHESVSGVRLIPTGSIADQILVRDGDDVVALTFGTRPVKVDNIGKLPMAWVDPAAADSRTVLASGAEALAEYQRALDEWRVLTAAALVGLVEETMTIAAEFAKTRYTLGVPDLDAAGASRIRSPTSRSPLQGGRNLARRAAWFLDNEPDERPRAGPVGVRVHGRGGVEGRDHGRAGAGRARACRAEAAATAYLVRARGWALAGGDPGASAKYIAEIVAARESEGSLAMDFSRVELSDEDEAFLHESRDFLRELVTDEVLRRDRETGDNFDEGVHLALGEAGYLTREWKPEAEGGFSRVRSGASGSWRSAGRMCRG